MLSKGYSAIILLVMAILHHSQVFASDAVFISGQKNKPEISLRLSDSLLNEIKSGKLTSYKDILSLHLVEDGVAHETPVTGGYKLIGKRLVYTTLYALPPDNVYKIAYWQDGQVLTTYFETPHQALENKEQPALEFYPRCDTIPSNILFFHVRFSRPMQKDVKAYRYFKIYDEHDKLIDFTWRQKSYWMDSGRVLLLMIHPGRVKSGIHYKEPIFTSGKKYTIRLADTLKDADCRAVYLNTQKLYTITAEDRTSPQMLSVTTNIAQGSFNPIYARFSEKMDYASTVSGIIIQDFKGIAVMCKIELVDGDSTVKITPLKKWVKGNYKITFDAPVSDLAANRINRLFEVTDIKEKERDNVETSFIMNVR